MHARALAIVRPDALWKFERDEMLWTWQRVDIPTGELLERSDTPFEDLPLCVEDAKKHGYTPPRAGESLTGSFPARSIASAARRKD